MLTKKQLKNITSGQLKRQKKMRSVPKEGVKINHLGKKFIVHKNVAWPTNDSIPLIESYQIHSGEHILDVCTGSGVIAIFSAHRGAKKIVALDINPDAIRTAKINAKLHGLAKIIDIRLSDMFDALRDNEKFDVITGNLPFRNKIAGDFVESSQWDTNLNTHKKFFAKVNQHLKPNGRIYLSQANHGAVKEMKQMAKKAGFTVKIINRKKMPDGDPRIYYAFELRRK